MKAQDLMIGDWVMDTRSNTPLRVNPFLAQLEVPEWKPIPLTPEILEKNWWCVRGAYSTTWLDAENTLMLEYYPHLGSLRKIYIHKDFSEEIVFRCDAINYVHEFQHALRLCGIEKEE